jgi:quercetin dioxygenase-like cupin family protein
MVESKYSKYIVTDYLSEEEILNRGRTPDKREPGVPFANGLLWLDEKIIKGAFYMELVMLEPGSKSTGVWVKPHVHEYDEIIGFVGTNVQNPRDLGGEVELWLDDEKHILTKTCLVFIPKGLRHCPLVIVKVDTPIVQFSVMTGRQYLWTFV